jgi:peptidyl-prolyl cis-trans isomerase C
MRKLLAASVASLALATGAFAQDKPYDAETVLATVNGTEITLGHVIALRDRLPQQYQELPDDVLFKGLIDQLVDQEVLAASASESPDTDPMQVRLQLENERRGALAGIAAEAAVVDAVDDAKVQAAYDQQIQGFQPQPEFNASHILVDSEEKAKALKGEIDGGADFAEVAKANSSDGSAASGGELGWFGIGQMVPEFEAAVREAEPGSVIGPIQTQFGWHVIKLNETRESSPPPLDEVRPQIEDQLRQQALQARLESLKAEAEIERPETGLPPAAIRESDLLN